MRVALQIVFRQYLSTVDVFEDEIEHSLVQVNDWIIKEYINTKLMEGEETKPVVPVKLSTSKDHEEESGPSVDVGLPVLNLSESETTFNFSCGNPDGQTIHGIMHLFNDRSKSSEEFKSDLVCMLSVPTMFNLTDVLSFLLPYTSNISGIRILRDRNPNTFMVLIKFTEEEKAEEFYNNQHSQPYNSLEDVICQLAFVTCITFGDSEVHPRSLASGPFVELPKCVVCLERLDETTTGMLTVVCNHTFHCECMRKCTTCPVCRAHAVPPELQNSHSCMVCGNTEMLWLCLICGYVGCGRYEGGHARGHFERTNHTYSMDVEQRCVWDYIGDNYVHRLIQNKADGKIVAVQNRDDVLDEKFESLTLEYSYLLTQQLESQREFFEKKLLFVEQEAMERIIIVEEEVQRVTQVKDQYKEQYEAGKKLTKKEEDERRKWERKVENLSKKLNTVSKELGEERELNKCLQENQKEWIAQVVSTRKDLEASNKQHRSETEELREQIKDLMFHFQSQATINSSPMKEEIRSGDVHVVAGPSNETPKTRRSPRKKCK